MGENRQQLKDRLQAAGLWQDYLALRQQLTRDGLTAAQAREEALRQIESRPPQPSELPTDRPSDYLPDEDLDQTTAAPESGPDFNRHVPNYDAAQWVAENLANPNVRPQDAPSGLAWGLLSWVRLAPANQTTFWGSIWPKLLPTGAALKQRQESDEAEKVDEGTERVLETIDDLLKKFQREDWIPPVGECCRPGKCRWSMIQDEVKARGLASPTELFAQLSPEFQAAQGP